MKKLFTLVFALMAVLSVNADELYLVGDGTPIGWEGDGNMRQTMRMTETETNVYVWTGLLKHGGEGFKIVNSFGGWDGYHPSSENFAIGDSGTDNYTTSGNDWKWNPTNTEWQWYTITLDKNAGTLSWATTTPTLLEAVDGVYYIGTAEELNTLALMYRNNVNEESYKVKLTADIDYTAYKNGSMSAIGVTEKFPFRGEFDGQSHTITVDLESYSTRFGFFGTIQGKVHHLKIAGKITATNQNQIGGICGLLKGNDNKIYNCISAVEIVDTQSGDGTIGGFCAVTYDATSIENCAFYGKISAPGRNGNGGIVGWCNSGASTTIKNCLVVADINWNGGEDFGRNAPSVINCYKVDASDASLANGEMTYKLNSFVSGSTDWYQTLGTDAMPSPLYTSEKLHANGDFYCDGVTPKGDYVLSNIDNFNPDPHTFGENGICTACKAAGQEAAEVDGVFQLNNPGNLLWWAKYVNAGNPASQAVLNVDVDLSEAKYTPAGNSDNKYVGTFDGKGHSITFAIDNPTLNYQGLFGVANDGATIKNVVIKGSVSGNSYVAGIVGGACGGVDGQKLNIINCGNEATITAANANGAGIIGVNMSGVTHFYILNCYNTGNVTSGRESGAITGWTGGNNSTIENTYNIGTIVNGEGDGFIRGGGNLFNIYNLSATNVKVTGGELCYNLGGTFGQTLGVDPYPNFTGKKVFAFGDTYTNMEVETATGDADCILPSMKWGGSYQAYTYVAQGNFDFGDWNTGNPNYNVIIGTPAEQDGKAWFAPGYDVTSWNYGQDLPNFGDGRPADVYAVRYFTVDGEIPTDLYMPAAHDDAPCEYYINGELIWAETDGWKEDEVVRLSDAQKALIKTDGRVNVFAFHVHQNWGGRYADGGLYTAGNMVNDFWSSYGNLDAVFAKAEADGVDAEWIDAAKARTNYRGGMDIARNAIIAGYRLKNVDTQENIFKGSAPADGGQYYIYNVGAKRYLTGGVDYGTHAAVNFAAQLATFRANEGGFRIHTNIRNGSDALNFNAFVDCGGDGDTWYLNEVSEGVYNISRTETGEGKVLLGYNGPARNNWWQVDSDCEGTSDPNNQWILVTKEERDALLAEATAENPVDATYYIHAAGFDHWLVPSTLAWPQTHWTWNNGGDGGWEPDFVYEVWHAGETDMSQTLEGLPAGKYIASVQGYYRDGDNTGDYNYQGDRQEAYFYAGDAQVLLPNIAEGADQYPLRGNNAGGHGIVPDSREDAAGYFGAGLYKVSVEVTVGADGTLKIGAHKSANVPNDWMVLDNFRLTYLGNPVEATIGEIGYATFVAPANINNIPASIEVFAAQKVEDKNYVHLEPVTAIPAGEAVVLKGEEGTYTMYTTLNTVELGTSNDLMAATSEVIGDGTQYVLDSVDGVVGFYKVTPSTTIALGKGYLVFTGAGVKGFYPFGDDATGIANINNALEDGAIYNVAGQRISKTQRGINIINGKKVLK